MPQALLSKARERNIRDHYEPLRNAHRILQAHSRNYISGNPTPDPHHKRAGQRPEKINLMIGRVENAQNKVVAEAPETAKPAPAPAPAPAKGGKGAKVGAFITSMFVMLHPPLDYYTSNRPIYIGSMSIGGRKPEPE